MTRARLRYNEPWVDGHTYDPAAYEPTATVGRWARCLEPESRVGAVYNPTQNLDPEQMRTSGMQYVGIGCAWRETGIAAPTVGYTWAGEHTDPHLETAALAHVTPGTQEHAIGAWASTLFGGQVIYVGTIGNPPEWFDVLDTGIFTTTTGEDVAVQLVSDGEVVTVFIDGEQIPMGLTGTAGVPIPEVLLGSTLHGVAFDAHLAPPGDIPDYDLFTGWYCTSTA